VREAARRRCQKIDDRQRTRVTLCTFIELTVRDRRDNVRNIYVSKKWTRQIARSERERESM
jgi:hypothetical protein